MQKHVSQAFANKLTERYRQVALRIKLLEMLSTRKWDRLRNLLGFDFDPATQSWIPFEVMAGVSAPLLPNSHHLAKQGKVLKEEANFVYDSDERVATVEFQTCLKAALEITIKARKLAGMPIDLSKPIVITFKADSASIGTYRSLSALTVDFFSAAVPVVSFLSSVLFFEYAILKSNHFFFFSFCSFLYPGHGRRITPVCFVLSELALCANSPDETFAFAMFDGDDSQTTIKEALSEETLKMIRELDDFELEIDGHKIRFKRTEGGDLKYLNSSFGLAGCNSTSPCVLCTTPRSQFGDFTRVPELRTLEHLVAFSHTKAGVYCDVCCKNVTAVMVEEAKRMATSDAPADVAARKQHMQAHESVLPGVGPLWHIEPRFDSLNAVQFHLKSFWNLFSISWSEYSRWPPTNHFACVCWSI
jgi:hypothetical protein